MLRLPLNRRMALWLALVLMLLVPAFLFPTTGAAGVASLMLVGLSGAVLAHVGPGLDGSASKWLSPRARLVGVDLVITLVLCAASVRLFGKSWNVAGYRIYDWGPHHANLAHLVDALREGRVPAWVHGVSTGDSPFELYAFLPYYLAAKAAILTGATDLTLVMVRSGIVTHVLAALGSALLARRVLRWPWAILVGLATLYDVGSVWGGGVDGLLLMGVTHSAFAQAIWTFALIAVIGSLKRPALWRSACIWGLVAFAVACHPLAIVSALASMGALVLVALLGRDVPPHRALFALVHVAIGLLLVAFVWMPFGERVLLYGVHYGIAPKIAWDQFGQMMNQPVPETSTAALVYAGYLGTLVGVLSRRAALTLLASFAGVIMAGLFDQGYTLLGLVPSLETAGFQMVRLPAIAKPSLYVLGIYLLDSALIRLRAVADERTRWVTGALVALALVGMGRGALPYFDRLAADLRSFAYREVPDSAGLRALAAWAREQADAMPPGQYGRLLDEDERRTFAVFHVHAESGLPALWPGPTLPLFFLRERMEEVSPESLRRFNVRWVVRADHSPARGDPATERRFGRYIVRELPEWDGRFARVERGAGSAVVTHLDDERVEVELSHTTEPALVALGMGYYPRWQATHELQGDVPVYALPAYEGAELHVVAAWLPPGRTTFRPTGALPSDGKGRISSALAALLALGIVGVWSGPRRLRGRILVSMARARAWLDERRGRVALGSFALLASAALVASVVSSRGATRALRLGNGLARGASVEAKLDGDEWRECGYSPLYGAYRCRGQVLVQDTLTNLLNDAPPSLPYTVPAISVAAVYLAVDVRITVDARLSGEYWAMTNGRAVQFTAPDAYAAQLSGVQTSHWFEGWNGRRTITLTARVPARNTLQIAFVQRERLEPQRSYAMAPERPAER